MAVLDADEFEGKTAKAIRQSLAAKFGISRFWQRFFLQNESAEIADVADVADVADDEVLASPLKVHLVVLELSSPDAEQRGTMISASSGNDLVSST